MASAPTGPLTLERKKLRPLRSENSDYVGRTRCWGHGSSKGRHKADETPAQARARPSVESALRHEVVGL